MPEFSVVTIVKGRRKQLSNLLQSVKNSTILPKDIQIVCMDDGENIAIPSGLNVNIHQIENKNNLPLAASRNRGISATETKNIIFIDVDCIVSSTLFVGMLSRLEKNNIIAAYPLYLSVVPDSGIYKDHVEKAIPHPSREHIPANQKVHHLQFWSLIFAVQKEIFEKIGGFDESFTGYGAEDTDFAMMFHQKGIEQIFVPDYVLHQYHDKYDPPLNYFHSIITNANRYREKWNVLPMQRWLKAFETMDLIKIDKEDRIIILKDPTEHLIQKNVSPNPY